MSRPTVAADAAVKHVILYLKGTASLGILLGYNLSNTSKLSEIHGAADPEDRAKDLAKVFTDADWGWRQIYRSWKETFCFFSHGLCQWSPGDSLAKDSEKHSP